MDDVFKQGDAVYLADHPSLLPGFYRNYGFKKLTIESVDGGYYGLSVDNNIIIDDEVTAEALIPYGNGLMISFELADGYHVSKEVVEKYNKLIESGGKCLGTTWHEGDNALTDLGSVSHIVKRLTILEDKLQLTYEPLYTPRGKILSGMLATGASISPRLRGYMNNSTDDKHDIHEIIGVDFR